MRVISPTFIKVSWGGQYQIAATLQERELCLTPIRRLSTLACKRDERTTFLLDEYESEKSAERRSRAMNEELLVLDSCSLRDPFHMRVSEPRDYSNKT